MKTGIGLGIRVCRDRRSIPSVEALFRQAGVSGFYGTGALNPKVMLQKLRTDYPEFAVYSALSVDGTRWARWYFTNRLNVGNSGLPRMVGCTEARLFASATTAGYAANLTTGTEAQNPSQAVASASGTRTGTFTGPTTVSSVTNVYYSTTVGDKTVYSLTNVRRIAWRTVANASNGGIVKIVVKDNGGTEIAAGYTVPLTGSDRLLDLRTFQAGLNIIPLADDLALGNYTIEITVFTTNPAGGRSYDAGMNGYALTAYNAAGHMGTWANMTAGGITNVPTSYSPGAQAIYPFTGTKVAWKVGKLTAGGQADVRVYDSGGTEISAGSYVIAGNQVDTYYASTAFVDTVTIAKGLTYGTYYLFIENKTTKNASSTGNRIADNGIVSYDENTAGVVGIDAFDDQGVIAYTDGTVTLIGSGNLEHAIRACKPAEALAASDFCGGTHGHESAPANLVYKIDGSVIDFASGAVGATWVGNSRFDYSCSTNLLFPSDSTPFASFSFAGTISRDGYHVDTTRTITAQPRIFEDYALMLNVPSTQAGTQGISGGFQSFSGLRDTSTTRSYTAHNDSNNSLGRPINMGLWFNAGYAVVATHYNADTVRKAMAAYQTGDQTALSFVQDRSDKYVKWYNRACPGDSANGFLLAVGNTYRSIKTYRPLVLS